MSPLSRQFHASMCGSGPFAPNPSKLFELPLGIGELTTKHMQPGDRHEAEADEMDRSDGARRLETASCCELRLIEPPHVQEDVRNEGLHRGDGLDVSGTPCELEPFAAEGLRAAVIAGDLLMSIPENVIGVEQK
jgi:hypothetical protein